MSVAGKENVFSWHQMPFVRQASDLERVRSPGAALRKVAEKDGSGVLQSRLLDDS